MKIVNISYNQLKEIIQSKNLFLQYVENAESYDLFVIETNISWECGFSKNTDDAIDFETNYKSTANKPLEYRSTDGLPKVAASKFADQLSFWLDGTAGKIDIPSGTTVYMKKHFDFPYTLSGVDIHWYDANWGDKLDFTVGIYTDPTDENTFTILYQFADDYHIYKDGDRVIDVPTVKTLPSTVTFNDVQFDIYIRVKCENVGPNASKVLIRLIGWK